MSNGKFRLLEAFRRTFADTLYRHRDPTLGNKIGRELFEDLFAHRVSSRYVEDVERRVGVINRWGKIHTPRAVRRNDSVFGRPPAGVDIVEPIAGCAVPEGPVAEPRIGCEVKIIAKSQQKQIDRVISDLETFAARMKSSSPECINVAVVGINREPDYVGHEGLREFKHRLRDHEPTTVLSRLRDHLIDRYDGLLLLEFRATNQAPYPFLWIDAPHTELDYGSTLTRVGHLYQQRSR